MLYSIIQYGTCKRLKHKDKLCFHGNCCCRWRERWWRGRWWQGWRWRGWRRGTAAEEMAMGDKVEVTVGVAIVEGRGRRGRFRWCEEGGGDGAMVVATEAAVRGAGGGDSLFVFDRCLSKPSARKAEIGVTDVFGDRRFTFQFIPASTHLRVDHHDARATASDVRPRPRCTTRAT